MTERIALHLGVDIRDLYAVRRRIAAGLTVEGDGWNAWGEPVGSACNDNSTLHVVVPIAPAQAEAVVADLSDTLVRMSGSTAIAVATTPDDWDVTETGGCIWHRIRRVDRSTLLVTERVGRGE